MKTIKEVVQSQVSALAWYYECEIKLAVLDEKRKALDAVLAPNEDHRDIERSTAVSTYEPQSSKTLRQAPAAICERQAELNAKAAALSAQVHQARVLLEEAEALKKTVVLARLGIIRNECNR